MELGAVDLAMLVARCGGAESLERSLELVQKHACSRGNSGAAEILAFEENGRFVYARADMSCGPTTEEGKRPQQATRRVFLLKPSTLVVEDVLRSPNSELSIRWTMRSAAEPKIERARFRVTAGNTEVIDETLLPSDAAPEKTARPARE